MSDPVILTRPIIQKDDSGQTTQSAFVIQQIIHFARASPQACEVWLAVVRVAACGPQRKDFDVVSQQLSSYVLLKVAVPLPDLAARKTEKDHERAGDYAAQRRAGRRTAQ